MQNFTSYTLHILQTKAKSKIQIKFSQNRFSMREIDENNRAIRQSSDSDKSNIKLTSLFHEH